MVVNQEHDHAPDSTPSADEAAQNKGDQAARAWRGYLLPILLAVVLAAILVSRLNPRRHDAAGKTDGRFAVSETGESIGLEIDFGDGAFRRYFPIPWKDGITVADAMKLVRQHRHGVQFRYEGEGEKAMLVRIEEVQNQGGDEGARNWVYEVNGKRATVSFAVYRLAASDTVLWKFTFYDYNGSDAPAVGE